MFLPTIGFEIDAAGFRRFDRCLALQRTVTSMPAEPAKPKDMVKTCRNRETLSADRVNRICNCAASRERYNRRQQLVSRQSDP